MAVIQRIDPKDAYALTRRDNAIVLDVRSPREYKKGHIEGAISLPVKSITKESAQKVIPNLTDNVIVYCKSGMRANRAAIALADLGYTNIHNMGGFNQWKNGFVN